MYPQSPTRAAQCRRRERKAWHAMNGAPPRSDVNTNADFGSCCFGASARGAILGPYGTRKNCWSSFSGVTSITSARAAIHSASVIGLSAMM